MRKLNFYSALALCSLSGCLWFLAVAPFDFSALAWVAAVPMLMAVDGTTSFRRALFLGWWAGLVETAGGFHWLIDTMRRFSMAGRGRGVAALLRSPRHYFFVVHRDRVPDSQAPQCAHDPARAHCHG